MPPPDPVELPPELPEEPASWPVAGGLLESLDAEGDFAGFASADSEVWAFGSASFFSEFDDLPFAVGNGVVFEPDPVLSVVFTLFAPAKTRE